MIFSVVRQNLKEIKSKSNLFLVNIVDGGHVTYPHTLKNENVREQRKS